MAKCAACDGKGGTVEDTSSEGVRRQNWRRCETCKGTGNK